MYLRKLTLRGFKSFASTTGLSFEPGITCIVGPNGSGKSNVVDALAWVMGEQGAKSLRGGSMEDVIFAGSSSRAPLGRAEIQLTIDNSDGALPIDYSEVTISRTKFRNGNSEYAINGTTCRLLDVRELLSDSGIGREMHVVVGQGHLEQILQATPEGRRGLIEEAAGILKHRERKEKALRKLDATEANLHRLTDLIAEIRRQLKPLGRQAELTRRASVVQADLRDAKARLLADDLTQAHSQLKTELADEHALRAKRDEVEAALAAARQQEDLSRVALSTLSETHWQTQETWVACSGIAERVRSTINLATEQVRLGENAPELPTNPARDPETLIAQAEKIAADEAQLRVEVARLAEGLESASAIRTTAETDSDSAEIEFQGLVRDQAARREGIARLTGQISSLNQRQEAGATQLEELEAACLTARDQAEQANDDLAQVQRELPAQERSQVELAEAVATAQSRLDDAQADLEANRRLAQSSAEAKAGLTARVEALRMAQGAQGDAAAWLEQSGFSGLLGPLARMIEVEPGFEPMVAQALGAAAEAVVTRDREAGWAALTALRGQERGRAGLLMPASAAAATRTISGARSVISYISGDEAVCRTLSHLLVGIYVAASLEQARQLVDQHPEITVVTPDGASVSRWLVSGGADQAQSGIQIAAAVHQAEEELVAVTAQVVQGDQGVLKASERLRDAQADLGVATAALRDFETKQAAGLARQAQLNQAAALAGAKADQAAAQLAAAKTSLDQNAATLADLRQRLTATETADDFQAPDPSEKDRLAEVAKAARAAEMEARLGLRTVEERARALSGQASSLRAMAEAERQARLEAERRQAQIQRQAECARTVIETGQWLLERVLATLAQVEQTRVAAGEARLDAEAESEQARLQVRALSSELEQLVDSAHRDELARTQQQMRIDALAERAMTEVGLDQATLMSQYGPDQPVIGPCDPETGEATSRPFLREEQLKRLRMAERDLQVLGKVNPLALEEYDAMQERHGFLASQLEDLKKTRADLLSIVDDVDARVQEVFAAAYADVEREFAELFGRLFPGGEGRLLLTEPGQWLTTGIEVEARPAGKKIKRLSLLSGGERSLVAVCFLIALFKARPSPFYVLDEVEAALDDANLSRLLQIYEELRRTSQLIVITHQKRTMEVADTLYGVTMGSDGTSTVVSQRLRED